jgi:hypothetical protein
VFKTEAQKASVFFQLDGLGKIQKQVAAALRKTSSGAVSAGFSLQRLVAYEQRRVVSLFTGPHFGC